MKHILSLMDDRCQALLLLELKKAGFPYTISILKQRLISEISEADKYAILNRVLLQSLIPANAENQSVLTDEIKRTVISAIRYQEVRSSNFSGYLSKKLRYSYAYLSIQFSRENGCTLNNYIIHQKIQRAKELILDGRHTLSEISWMLRYSSVAHLSNQFKKVTGSTPTDFRKLGTDQCTIYRRVNNGQMENSLLLRQGFPLQTMPQHSM